METRGAIAPVGEAWNAKKEGELMGVNMLLVDESRGAIAPVGEAWNAKKEGELMGVDMLLVDESSAIFHGHSELLLTELKAERCPKPVEMKGKRKEGEMGG
ncbi:hypothetical protein F2Q68_00019610 [Brassica cretica]|uniref:Uncharacterized protein n=1 Tax=Brassica cretica TaxID=69181 RepID=A0A8S9FTL5_BRACR|nr:hypothetical protein F2Q68_00019610 [Brassica cretica]